MTQIISGDVNFEAVPTKISINFLFVFFFFLRKLGVYMATLNIMVFKLGEEVGWERVPVLG